MALFLFNYFGIRYILKLEKKNVFKSFFFFDVKYNLLVNLTIQF